MKFNEFNVGMLEIIVIVMIAIIGWAISLEVRLANATNYNSRLENLEELMLPIMVDWKVRKELEATGHGPACFGSHRDLDVPISPPRPIYTGAGASYPGGDTDDPDVAYYAPESIDVEIVEQDATNWAEQMIQRPMKMKK